MTLTKRGIAVFWLEDRSEEHTAELHHKPIPYAVFCLKKKTLTHLNQHFAGPLRYAYPTSILYAILFPIHIFNLFGLESSTLLVHQLHFLRNSEHR